MRLKSIISCFAIITITATTSLNAAEKIFRAGAFAADITPIKLPVIVNGGMQERLADKVVDHLHARCLVLDDGEQQAAIVVVDSCMVPSDILDHAKEMASKATGIPTSNMLIASTHTHSAPSVFGALGSDVDKEYAAFLPGQIAKGIVNAHKRLQPAEIGWAMSPEPKNVFIRRFLMKEGTGKTNLFSGTKNDRAQMNPGYKNKNVLEPIGVPDTDVWVLALRSPAGKPIALLANYGTHYAGAPALSADYFGVFCELMTNRLPKADEDFVALMSNGTSGDTNCYDFRRPERRKFDRFTVAEDVAQAALKAYGKIEFQKWVPLVMHEEVISLRVRLADEAEVAKAKEYLKQFEGRKPKELDEIYARETVLMSELPPTRSLKLQALRLGDLGIGAIPNEVYSSTGLDIKKNSPLKATFVMELANGCFGYLSPPEQHKLGGYTCWRARSSCLEVDAEPKVRAKVLELLRKTTE